MLRHFLELKRKGVIQVPQVKLGELIIGGLFSIVLSTAIFYVLFERLF